ncbi:DUF6082 family protein [Streptomyces spectabilis]|uniref:Uncharacterized protein n=1 Tax=Streptomyces spectabilis TaxID=68270 RepID=A0A516REN4_STRST|nr:DUF6082 family protein [Streptomyces spectabilis]QDQ14122.1 hypothetical protein FH965_29040 [Streptomyces spectabilis]
MVTQKHWIRGTCPAALAGLAITTGALTLAAMRLRRNMALTEQHRLHFALLCKAMEDEALAAVLDTYDSEVPQDRHRQFLFANALYTNALHAYRTGAMSLGELYGHLRVMCQNPIFREYWEATRHHRASLHRSSEEAEVGHVLDGLARDLREADTDEWWVVGRPPVD